MGKMNLLFSCVLFCLMGCTSNFAHELAYRGGSDYYYRNKYKALSKLEQEEVDKEYVQIVRKNGLFVCKEEVKVLSSIEVLDELYEAIQKNEIKCVSDDARKEVEAVININLCNQINNIKSQKIICRLAKFYTEHDHRWTCWLGGIWFENEKMDLPKSIFEKIEDKKIKKKYVKKYLLSEQHINASKQHIHETMLYCFNNINTLSELDQIFSKSQSYSTRVEAEKRIDNYISKLAPEKIEKIRDLSLKKKYSYKIRQKAEKNLPKRLDSKTDEELLDIITQSSTFKVREQAILQLKKHSSTKLVASNESLPLVLRIVALLEMEDNEELVEQFVDSYYAKPENNKERKAAINYLKYLYDEYAFIYNVRKVKENQTLLKLLVMETDDLKVKLDVLKRIKDYYFRYNVYKELAQSDNLEIRNEAIRHIHVYKHPNPKAQRNEPPVKNEKVEPPLPSSPSMSIGTCWFFNSTDVATCYHVIQGRTKYNIFSEALDKSIPLDLVAFDEEKDIAILRIQPKNSIENQTFLSLANEEANIADRVFTMGFPNPLRQGTNIKYTAGDINSKTGLVDSPWMYQVSVPIQSGNSGGPLINEEDGAVVGLIFATLKNDTHTLTQNVNYAVKVEYLIDLAKRNNCNITFSSTKKTTKKDIVRKCESSIYLIEAK